MHMSSFAVAKPLRRLKENLRLLTVGPPRGHGSKQKKCGATALLWCGNLEFEYPWWQNQRRIGPPLRSYPKVVTLDE